MRSSLFLRSSGLAEGEEERVGGGVREPGLERRPRERNAARPCEAPSGRMNFSLSSRFVRPRAGEMEERRERKREEKSERAIQEERI